MCSKGIGIIFIITDSIEDNTFHSLGDFLVQTCSYIFPLTQSPGSGTQGPGGHRACIPWLHDLGKLLNSLRLSSLISSMKMIKIAFTSQGFPGGYMLLHIQPLG